MAQPIWNTTAGILGIYPAQIPVAINLSATAVLPAVSITYTLLSGSLPSGLSITESGVISGIPSLVTKQTSSTFTIRATDNYQNIRDRTFSIDISGSAIPELTTPAGNILQTWDSIWIQLPIQYSNPDTTNPVVFTIAEGRLPPGLEINESGLIRGYAEPPTTSVTLPSIVTTATVTETSNIITCFSTIGFTPGRPVTFSGLSLFGGLEAGVTYYIKSITSATQFTVSTTQFGPTLNLTSGTGFMTVTLPSVSVGQPTVRTYSFSIKLDSPLGSDISSYSITVINQNAPTSQGGPGKPNNTRVPAILNTRPATYNLTQSDPYYGYYLLPVDGGTTYPPNVPAPLENVESDNYFAFKIIGTDFDGDNIRYSYVGLPPGLTGDVNTGWITGTPILSTKNISAYNFKVAVYKVGNPAIQSDFFSFRYILEKDLTNVVIWDTPADLGTIFNGTISTKSVSAIADVDLEYRIIGGSLPPNLTLISNGEITGYVADQPTTQILYKGDTTSYTFTVEAFSAFYPVITSTKTFTITVLQEYTQPTDILYIKCTPSIEDRLLINSLLTDDTLIPTEMLYRPNDVYFGKATSVIYEHAYGIYASNIQQYLAAVTQNHYWRNITLGELETAIARDENGDIVYEVVYSKVIDNLINPQGVSISSMVQWPRTINLFLGPWYTSVTDIYASYVNVLGQDYYTSLTPGSVNELYPNSLPNMRNRVSQVLGQEYDSRLLPLWMTSQQLNGSTLGFTPAWVICYTKPGFAETIKNNIQTNWVDPIGRINKLNAINFQIDRFSVNKSTTYDYDNTTQPPAWTGLPSATPVPDPLNSKDFNVLFPRKTILPNETQY